MPGMDGFQMSEEIHRIVDGVEIYAVTAMNEAMIRGRHSRYGVKAVLGKPVRKEMLESIFREVFNITF